MFKRYMNRLNYNQKSTSGPVEFSDYYFIYIYKRKRMPFMLNTQIGCWWMLCCLQVSTNNLTAMKLLAFDSLTFVRTRDHRGVFCTDAWRRMTRKRTRFAVAECSETSTDEMPTFTFFFKNTISLSHRKRQQHRGKDTVIDLYSTRPLQSFRYRLTAVEEFVDFES